MGRVGREVHVERRAARRLPYEVLCGLGVQVGVVYLGAVVANDLTVLVYVVGGGAGVGSFPGVPPVPARRHVGGRGIVTVAVQPIAVEVLADEDGVVSRSVEPGGYRGVLEPVVVEVPEAPHRRHVDPHSMVVGVLAPQSACPGGTAQRTSYPRLCELHTLTGQEALCIGHVVQVRGSHVVCEYEHDIGPRRICYLGETTLRLASRHAKAGKYAY